MRLSSLSVNPKQKFWLRCAPPSSHMWGLYIYFWIENYFGYNIGTSSFTSNKFNVFYNNAWKTKFFKSFIIFTYFLHEISIFYIHICFLTFRAFIKPYEEPQRSMKN